MNVADLMRKSEDALKSARLLFDNGLHDDACSRAYYAMFDAARAALQVCGAPVQTESFRTHRRARLRQPWSRRTLLLPAQLAANASVLVCELSLD